MTTGESRLRGHRMTAQPPRRGPQGKRCFVSDCPIQVSKRLPLRMCSKHWKQVPEELRHEIIRRRQFGEKIGWKLQLAALDAVSKAQNHV